ncbi:MAG: hypothetical protein ACI8W7_003586 [Gammaproteobacteria bacterium]|jgi:hypothetical protein
MNTRIKAVHRGLLLASLLMTALIYWPGLNGPLILDDVDNLDLLRILSAQQRLNLSNLLAERGGWFGGRPVSWLTFYWTWQLASADVWMFKLHNLLLHLLNGILVFFIARLIFRQALTRDGSNVDFFALAVCAFWLLTPIQVSSVLYVVQRMTVLAATFVLLGVLSYCTGRLLDETRPTLARTLVAVSLLVCWPLAALSKQTGALLPIILLATEVFVLSGARRTGHTNGKLVGWLSLGVLVAGTFRAVGDPEWIMRGYELREFTLSERLLTQPRVLFDYALNVLQLPGGSQLGLFHDDFAVSTSWRSPSSTTLAIVGLLAIASCAWWFRHTRARLFCYGISLFLVGHSLEAGPFALELYFEHRNYLPSLGLWIAVIALFELAGLRWMYVAVLCAALACQILTTANRVLIWSSWEGIVASNLQAHPESIRARAGGAARDLAAGRLDAGMRHLAEIDRLGGTFVQGATVLKALAGYCIANRTPEAAVAQRLFSLFALGDDAYTISALKWFRETVESGRCRSIGLPAIAAQLEILVNRETNIPSFKHRWALDESVARINVIAARPEAAAKLFRRALQRAPKFVQADIGNRLAQINQRIRLAPRLAH